MLLYQIFILISSYFLRNISVSGIAGLKDKKLSKTLIAFCQIDINFLKSNLPSYPQLIKIPHHTLSTGYYLFKKL